MFGAGERMKLPHWFVAGMFFVLFESSYWFGIDVLSSLIPAFKGLNYLPRNLLFLIFWFVPASLLFGLFVKYSGKEFNRVGL